MTFAPYTTQTFQVLDLTLFGALKRRPRYELPSREDKAAIKCIMNVYYDFTQTIVQPNVRGAFRARGRAFNTRNDPSQLCSSRKS
jgi:hypothetical protein